jgi:hypothetical protein
MLKRKITVCRIWEPEIQKLDRQKGKNAIEMKIVIERVLVKDIEKRTTTFCSWLLRLNVE